MVTFARNYPFLTQKEPDVETGLDYFGARYYGSTMGRFTSVDPVTVTPERFYDPQQFNIEGRRHLYLPGEQRGIFNPQGAKNTDEVLMTESVIDATALWSVGVRNVIPVYGVTGLTEEIRMHLVEGRVRRVVLLLDTGDADRAAAIEMSERCRPLRGLNLSFVERAWGLRPRLYAVACFAGLKPLCLSVRSKLRMLR